MRFQLALRPAVHGAHRPDVQLPLELALKPPAGVLAVFGDVPRADRVGLDRNPIVEFALGLAHPPLLIAAASSEVGTQRATGEVHPAELEQIVVEQSDAGPLQATRKQARACSSPRFVRSLSPPPSDRISRGREPVGPWTPPTWVGKRLDLRTQEPSLQSGAGVEVSRC